MKDLNAKMKKLKENLSGHIFLILALSALGALLLITVFIIVKAAPFIAEVGFFKFIFGMEWAPTQGKYGIFPMIAGTVSVTLGAIIIGVPIGICCAIFLAEFAPAKLRNAFRPVIQLLAGIPSVVYGFIGLIFIVPFIRNYIGGPGLSMLAGSLILAIMILPTVISISEVALLSLPRQYKEGALALGMTHWQTIWRVQIPAAKSGIIASVILGIGRAVGETMAVIMVLGNATALPGSVLDPVRTLTTNIGIEMGYAEGLHQQALFATGVVLFIIIMIINSVAQYINRDKLKGGSKRKPKTETITGTVTETKAGVKTELIKAPEKTPKTEIPLKPATETPQTEPGKKESRVKKRLSGLWKKIRAPGTNQKIAKAVIWAAAILVLSILLFILVFILVKGLPVINWKFLTENPRNMGRDGGVASTIAGTFLVTGAAVLIAIPFGIGAAFYLAEYTKENIFTKIIRFSVESLAGIPSIVYGLFGFIVFVSVFGMSVIAGGLTLAIMILPTIIRTSEEAIKTVPASYRETSHSLGATKWQTVRKVVFPSALRGIVNGVILSVGRCVAETAAVILTAGSAPRMRTMASHFYILVTEGISMENAYGTAALLIILILIINVGTNALVNRFTAKGR